MKICSCGTELTVKNKTGYCKPCYQKYYREMNKERLAEYDKTRYKTDPKRAAKNKEYHSKNKDKIAAQRKQAYQADCERIKAEKREYYKNNKDKYKKYAARDKEKKQAYMKKWREANYDKILISTKAWRKDNIDKARLITRRRKFRVKRATPSWAKTDEWEKFFLEEIYNLARLREECLGGSYHVDHIVPLKSDIVCGLHLSSNMQVLLKEENLAKGNRWWPDMPIEEKQETRYNAAS